MNDIDHVNPNEVKVEDIDEWIGLLDQLEEKLNQFRKHPIKFRSNIMFMFKNLKFSLYRIYNINMER